MIYDCAPGVYATGGVALDVSNAPGGTPPGISFSETLYGAELQDNIAGKGYTAQFDDANNLLKILDPAGTEVVNATDLDAAGVVLRIKFVGARDKS